MIEEWKESQSGQTIASMSLTFGKVQDFLREEVNDAIWTTHEAQEEWAKSSLQRRASYLYKWVDDLVSRQDEIADTLCALHGTNRLDLYYLLSEFHLKRKKDKLQMNLNKVSKQVSLQQTNEQSI